MDLKRLFPRASSAFLRANEKALAGIAPQILSADLVRGAVERLAPKRRGSMNATESDFKLLLLARFPDSTIRFEAYKLRIADRCWYCPDFSLLHLNGTLDFFECKVRHIWEDSKIKFKAAREMYPQHHWEMWQRSKGLWAQIL
jgi:hypothetical protein